MLLSLRSSYAYFLIRELPHDLYYRMWMYVMCAVATSNQITIVPIHSIMCIACVSVRMCVCDSLLVASQNHTQILYTTCYLLHKMHLYIYTQNGKWGKDTENWDWRRSVSVRAHSLLFYCCSFPFASQMSNNQTIWSRYRLAFIEDSSEQPRVKYRCTAFTSFINTLVATSSRNTAQIDIYQLFHNYWIVSFNWRV